jgi:predicted nucleic acid-binding Zn ribbon protein
MAGRARRRRPPGPAAEPDPAPVSASLDRLLDHLTGAPMATTTTIFDRWDDIVGEAVGAHTRPIRLREGVLTVGVDDPAWASQLKFLEADLLGQIAKAPGGSSVTGILFQVTGPR